MVAQSGTWLCVLGTSLLAICLASAAVIDPAGQGPDDTLLKTAAHLLDLSEIDVVLGNASELAPTQRPRVASLKGYAPQKKDWGSFSKEAWPYAFDKGVAGVLFAYRPQDVPKRLGKKKADCDRVKPSGDEEACRFVAGWLAAKPDDRVFLAFTNQDFEIAAKTKSALEQSGYIVFLFLKDKNEKPWASPALVGEVFAQATHRLVIDTAAARGSAGVRFESLCCEPLLMPPYPSTKWSRAIGGK